MYNIELDNSIKVTYIIKNRDKNVYMHILAHLYKYAHVYMLVHKRANAHAYRPTYMHANTFTHIYAGISTDEYQNHTY